MLKQKIIQKNVTAFFLAMPFLTAFAQDNQFDDDVVDVPSGPIDNYILIAVLIAIYIAFQFFKTQHVKK